MKLAVLHLSYPSSAARLRVLVDGPGKLERLGHSARELSLTDVPISREGQHDWGLELLVRTDSNPAAQLSTSEAWVRELHVLGLITSSTAVPASVVLQPTLFPGGEVPRFYARALAIGTERASRILRPAVCGEDNSSAQDIACRELNTTWSTLIPNSSERRAGLAWHATWLRAVAARSGNTTRVTATVGPAEGGPVDPEYAALRPSITRQIAAIERRARPVLGTDAPDTETIRAALVARLAHTQVMRLWGPLFPNALLHEAEIAQHLADSLV